MPPSIVVVIREDPHKTHRAVEALRIALGLSTGENPMTVVLLGQAPWLISEDPEDIVDGEILEKYLPSFKQLGIPFVLLSGSGSGFNLDPDFKVSELSKEAIQSMVAGADRVLVF
jgi:sulfur relay (sulfurtransferase) DsrF/TusC family protein